MTSEPDPTAGARGAWKTPPDDAFAAKLRGFGPVGLIVALIVLLGSSLLGPLRALPTLVWAWRARIPWTAIGYARPKHWGRDAIVGVVGGITLKFVMKAIVMPLLGADPINHAFHDLVGNTAALPLAALYMILGAGVGEETQFRGFLFERLGRLMGDGPGARVAIVVITAVIFGLGHWQLQALAGTQQALVVGLLFGAIYARIGRLWPLMCAHAAFDLTALAMIYLDKETAVAHLIFH